MTNGTHQTLLTEDAVRAALTRAGWTLATDQAGQVCRVDEWAVTGDFSTEAQDLAPDGSCESVLLLCRTADCVPELTQMGAVLHRAGFGTRRTEDGMEFLLVLPRPERGRRRKAR